MPRLRVQRDGNCAIEYFEWERACARFIWSIFWTIITPAWETMSYLLAAFLQVVTRAWAGTLTTLCILFAAWIATRFVLVTAQLAGYNALPFISSLVYSNTPRWTQALALHPKANLMNAYEMIERLEAAHADLYSAYGNHVAEGCSPEEFGVASSGSSSLSVGDRDLGASLLEDLRIRLEDTTAELDGLRSLVMEQAERVHAQDLMRPPIAEKPDFAHIGTGANWMNALTSPAGSGFEGTSGGYAKPRPNRPDLALHHDVGPGACWSFPGTNGYMGVYLATDVLVEEVAIDHSREDWDRTPAPRHMELWALIQGEEVVEKVKPWEAMGDHDPPSNIRDIFGREKFLRIAHFEYDAYSTDVTQFFPVDSDFRSLAIPIRIVVLLVLDNWGNHNHTCLYRLRVHGHPLV